MPTEGIFWSYWGGGKLNCIFARRLLLACMSGSSVFLEVYSTFEIHVEYSFGANALYSQYLLGWKSAARRCLKLIVGFSYFILSFLAIEFHFFFQVGFSCSSMMNYLHIFWIGTI